MFEMFHLETYSSVFLFPVVHTIKMKSFADEKIIMVRKKKYVTDLEHLAEQ